MNEKKALELDKNQENENEIVIIDQQNMSKSNENLINVKSLKSDLDKDIIERKSVNSIDLTNNEKTKEFKEFKSSSNLRNLSNLYRSFINKTSYQSEIKKRRRSIFPNINKFVINEKEEILNEADNLNLFNIIKDRIVDVKEDILQYLEETKNKLEIKYNNFIKNVNELLLEKEKQLSKILSGDTGGENFINYANKNLFNQLDDILEIHDYIFSALEDNFNLLYSFLDQSNLINQKKPIEYFIDNNSKDILNCWILNKFDFNQIDLSKIISNKELSDLFIGYVSKMNNNEYSSISLQKYNKENFPLEIELLNNNIDNVKKIKFIGLNKDDINNINKELNGKVKDKKKVNDNKSQAKKVRSLSIINSDFKKINPLKINFPSLKIFKLKNSFMDISYIFNYIINESNSLIKIHLENINFTDNSLKVFFELLSTKKSITNTLKSLSFKGNILTKISLDNFNLGEGVFKNLLYLNFSKNNIYEFSERIFRLVPELQVFDLTDNNISNRILFDFLKEGKKILRFISLLSNNIFIHNNNSNNTQYIKYISDSLSTFQHKIKKISFCLTFNQNNIYQFTKLKISPAVKISLYKLDLSFCGLNDENLWKFFKNNFGLLNLEVLNLSNNYLTNNFFDLCSGSKGDIILAKIKVIDLSFNDIDMKELKNLKTLEKFIDNHHELKRLKLQYTEFFEGFILLVKLNDFKQEVNPIIKKLISREIKFVLEPNLNNIDSGLLNNILSYKDKTY